MSPNHAAVAAWFPLLFLVAATTAGGSPELIRFPHGTSVAVQVTADGQFLGLGAMMIDGIPLSSCVRPMQIEVVGRADRYDVWHAPEPIAYTSRRLVGTEQRGNTGTVRVDLGHADGSTDRLEIVFEYVSERFYESRATGLRYHFRWSSPRRYAHQVRETSWWTFGDSVDGLRWISQNSGYGRGSADFVVENGRPFGGFVTSSAVETADLTRVLKQRQNHPLRFGYLTEKQARETRQGDGEFVTFASREPKQVSFLRYADTPTMNYWEYERLAGDKEVRFEEWYCVPLSHELATAPIAVQVLHKAGVNAWIDAMETVRSRLLVAAGLPPQEPLPWVAYTQHPVDDPETRTREQVPYEQALELMRRAGVREYWWYGPWKSNWSEARRITPEQVRKHGLLGHAVWDYDWADSKFDIPGLRRLAGQSRALGISPVLWLTQTMSQISPHVMAHPDWALRRPDGTLHDYVYPDLVGMNHHSGYSEFLVHRVRARREEFPFDAIWLDSFFFSADVLDWMDPDLWPNSLAALETMRKLRATGIQRIYTEINSPFALSSATGYLSHEELAAGQQCHLLYHTAPADHTDLPPAVYFRLLAFKCATQPYLKSYLTRPDFCQAATYANHAYVKALPHMGRCVVLDGDRGTLYWSRDGTHAVLFAFADGTVELDRPVTAAKEILGGTPCPFSRRAVSVQGQKVYLLAVKGRWLW